MEATAEIPKENWHMGNPPVFSLTYASSATELFSTEQLLALLQICRRNNASSGVTGMLLYKAGNFLQVLEGAEDAVRRLHARIAEDSRHHGLITLLEGNLPARQFGDWSMAFYNLSERSLPEVPGYNEFLNTPFTHPDFTKNPGKAKKLLEVFKKTM